MIKKLILTSVLLMSFNSISLACDLGKDYNSSLKINNSLLEIDIEKKDKTNLIFYEIRGIKGEAYIGFKFVDNKKITKGDLDTFATGGNIFLAKKLNEILTERDKLVSPTLSSSGSSQRYGLPLDEIFRRQAKSFSYSININEFTGRFNSLMKANDIYGKQRIKFYVKLITTPDLECAYFESEEITYDFPKSWRNIIYNWFK